MASPSARSCDSGHRVRLIDPDDADTSVRRVLNDGDRVEADASAIASGAAGGGGGRNRTGVDGFAGRCMTTLPPRPGCARRAGAQRGQTKRESGLQDDRLSLGNLERETSLELATSTLARLRSTN